MSNSLLEKIKADAATEVAAITTTADEKLQAYQAETNYNWRHLQLLLLRS